MIRDFALWFFCGFFLCSNPDLITRVTSFKNLPDLASIFCFRLFKKKTKIQFHLLKLGYWTLSFMIVFVFLSIGLSQSHVAGRELIELT
jgi:hypothetical protein